MLDTFALVALQRALNRLLARDPASPGHLATLDGHTLRVLLDEPGLKLRIAFHATGLELSRVRPQEPDDNLHVTLTREARERWIAGDSVERLLFSGALPVSGQTGLLPSIQALFMELDLDWEGALAKGLGSGNAHGVATGMRHLARQVRASGAEWQRDVREYVFEEGRWLTGLDQIEVARDQLTELDQRIDRLGARILRLQRRQGGRS